MLRSLYLRALLWPDKHNSAAFRFSHRCCATRGRIGDDESSPAAFVRRGQSRVISKAMRSGLTWAANRQREKSDGLKRQPGDQALRATWEPWLRTGWGNGKRSREPSLPGAEDVTNCGTSVTEWSADVPGVHRDLSAQELLL